jgi:hypothetical protein
MRTFGRSVLALLLLLLLLLLLQLTMLLEPTAGIAGHGTRPPRAPPDVDCAMRKLTISFAARLLGANRSARSLSHVVDGLEYARLCNVSTADAVGAARSTAPVQRNRVDAEPAMAVDVSFFVSTSGSDATSCPGSIEHPFKTVHRAVAAARAHRAEHQQPQQPQAPPQQPRVAIWLRAGTHFLSGSPVMLHKADSNMTIGAWRNEKAVLSGGRLLSPTWAPAAPAPAGASVARGVPGPCCTSACWC